MVNVNKIGNEEESRLFRVLSISPKPKKRGKNTIFLVSMQERSLDEAIIDRILLLYLVARTRRKGYNILGQIKLQKLLYKTQERMYLAKYKGFNYNFVRWKFGPFSQEIYSDVKDLKATGFLNTEDVASVSNDGQRLIEALGPLFDDQAREIIDRVINEFAPYTGRQIKAVMYSYPKVGEKRTIAEVEMGELILSKLDAANARKRFNLDEKKLETLRFLFDPSSDRALKQGLKALRTEESRPFIPVHR